MEITLKMTVHRRTGGLDMLVLRILRENNEWDKYREWGKAA
ncbi:MAG: hypothetical protein WBN77_03680 [Desulfobacterales bacterium]